MEHILSGECMAVITVSSPGVVERRPRLKTPAEKTGNKVDTRVLERVRNVEGKFQTKIESRHLPTADLNRVALRYEQR